MNTIKLNKYIIIIICSIALTSTAMERKKESIANLLDKTPSLTLRAAISVTESNQPATIEKLGAENLVDLVKKIRRIINCDICTREEKKLFLNLLNDPEINFEEFRNRYPQLTEHFLRYYDFEAKKIDPTLPRHFQALAQRYALTKENLKATLLQEMLNKSLLPNLLGVEKSEAEKTRKRRIDIPLLLIDAGIDLKWQPRDKTLLNWAIIYHTKPIVYELLEKGVDVNLQNIEDKETPLMTAVRLNDKKLVNLLIEKGANPKITNKSGETALQLALKNPDIDKDILEMLKKKE